MVKRKAGVAELPWRVRTGRKAVAVSYAPDDHQLIREAAAKAGKSMSSFVQDAALESAKKNLGKK